MRGSRVGKDNQQTQLEDCLVQNFGTISSLSEYHIVLRKAHMNYTEYEWSNPTT
jgi:hypothetical protein